MNVAWTVAGTWFTRTGLFYLLGRGCLFLFEGFLGARYGTAAKHFISTQKWASLGVLLTLVVLFLTIRLLLASKRTSYSQTG